MAAPDTTTPPRGRDLALRLVSEQGQSLLAVARRHSLCADDAHDACQRALEILLRRADSLDPETAAAWLRTVVKHEAMAVRTSRRRIVGPVEVDLDHSEARELAPTDERAADSERAGRSTEALSRLKPNEVRALVLKARGYSYREIAEMTGWSYTKVNRCLTEGRRAFLDRFAEIETGRECERWRPALSALADGEASAQDVAALRPHLRHCPACRAALREFRTAPARVAALAGPVALVADTPGFDLSPEGDDGPGGAAGRAWDAVAGAVHDRVVLSAHKLHAGLEVLTSGKAAVVAASATALAGGGAAALQHDAVPAPAVAQRASQAVSLAAAARPASDSVAAPARAAAATRPAAPVSPPHRAQASPPAATRSAPAAAPAPRPAFVPEFAPAAEVSAPPAPTPSPPEPSASRPAPAASPVSSSAEFSP